MDIRLSPGTMGLASQAIDLFGLERVSVGNFAGPVEVGCLSEEEVSFAEEFFSDSFFDEARITVTRLTEKTP